MQRIRRRSARPEDQIQRAVMLHLRTRGAPGVFAFAVPNGGYRKPKEAAIMKGLGVTAGVPDICIVKSGMALFLELKAEKGKVSVAQECAHQKIFDAGAPVVVATGLDAALAQLEKWGALQGKVQR